MSIFKRILSVTICVTMCLCMLSGCGEKYKESIIYFELLQQPKTLDPQIASSDSELIIVRNIYEGLMRMTDDEKIVCGASESYTYNNLTYTFNIKDDVVWSNGERVTAYDFEYGMRRAVDPKIKSPNASRLFSVTNAEAINNGSADVSTLGVKAIDETTLKITLCKEDENFLKTLTTSVCMPCNQEFFNDSIGKYGLDAEHIISNGSYRLTKWNKEDFGIRIYKNEEYSGEFEAQNAAVFISCIDDEAQTTRLIEDGGDIAFVPCDELDDDKNSLLVTENIQNICWVMTLSNKFNKEVRSAFAMGFSTEVYQSALPNGFDAAQSIYPEILSINTDGIGITKYNIAQAKSIMSAQISAMEDAKFPQATMYYYDTYGAKEMATAIVGHWQQNFSTFINIEGSENLDVIQKEISNKDLDFALFPIYVKNNSFSEYVKNFYLKNDNLKPDALQQELLDGNGIIPVAFQSTNISYLPTLENVVVEQDNGYIDFCTIIKR